MSAQAKYRPSQARKQVRDELRDFATRQAHREKIRKDSQQRNHPTTPHAFNKPKPDPTTMRQIKLTFRAVFEQPIGPLNPMGAKIPGTFPVELFGAGEKWQARSISSPRPVIYDRLTRFTNPAQGKQIVEAAFARQVEPWQAWGIAPLTIAEIMDKEPNFQTARMILPEEYADLGQGKFGFRQPEDYTHILHAPSIPPGAKIPPAACGASVDAKCFINNKANVQPSCQKCAEVWQAHYQKQGA